VAHRYTREDAKERLHDIGGYSTMFNPRTVNVEIFPRVR